MKLCRNCQHAKLGTFVRCQHPNNMKVNLVEGGMSPRQTPEFLRGNPDQCGPDGNWFEPIAVTEIV